MEKKAANILILIMLFGMLLQLALLFLAMDPDTLKWYDPNDYRDIAATLAENNPYSSPEDASALYRAPGYPFILSLMMRITGNRVLYLRIFHILLFPVFIFFLYRLGRDWKNQITGLLLAFMAVLYPYYIYVPLTMYPESILLYLLPVIIWLMLKAVSDSYWKYSIIASPLIALAVMMRPTAVFIIPVFVFFVSLYSGWNWKKFLSTGIIICLLPVLAVSGWMMRNYKVHGKPMFSSAGGYNLLLSYNENATISNKISELPENIQAELDAAQNRAEKNEIAAQYAKKFIKENPAKAFKLAFLKQLDLWNPFPRTTTKSGFARPAFKLIAALPYIIFLILGIIGLIYNRKDPFIIALVFLTIINCLLNGLIAVSVRYRLITDFAFILLAAHTLTNFWTQRRKTKIA